MDWILVILKLLILKPPFADSIPSNSSYFGFFVPFIFHNFGSSMHVHLDFTGGTAKEWVDTISL